jgi:dTDP-4-amino-4,6-dideoxygalactose transaminase
LRFTTPPDYIRHAYYKYYVFIRPEYLKVGWNRDRIIETLNARGIPCFSGSCSEIYLEKAFEREDLRPLTRLPVARELGETSLMFPVHPTLTEEYMQQTAAAVEKVMLEASL